MSYRYLVVSAAVLVSAASGACTRNTYITNYYLDAGADLDSGAHVDAADMGSVPSDSGAGMDAADMTLPPMDSGTTADATEADAGCTPACTGRSCGDDGCGGSCGVCANSTCNASGMCEPASLCNDSCATARNDVCEDGEPGSMASGCTVGSDCTDCGVRSGVSWPTETVASVDDTAPRRPGGSYYYFPAPVSLAIDSDGHAHVAFADRTGLHYAVQTTSGWNVEIVDSHPFANATMALDNDGIPHVVYCAGDGTQYATRGASSWTVETADAACATAYSIAFDSANVPHVAYIASGAKHAFRNTSSWTIETVDTLGQTSAAIALDASDQPHVVYFGIRGRSEIQQTLNYASIGAGGWTNQLVDVSSPTGGSSGNGVALAIDSHDAPHIAYHSYDSLPSGGIAGLRLTYATLVDGVWHRKLFADVFSGGTTSSSDPAIRIDGDGHPRIVCGDGNMLMEMPYNVSGFGYYVSDGSDWTASAIDSGGLAGGAIAFALDAVGNPHIVYEDPDNYEISFASYGP